MELVVAGTTLELEELLSRRGNPYWGLAESSSNGDRRYASRGLKVPSQGDQLPTLVFLAKTPLRLQEDVERNSRYVEDTIFEVDGRQLLASVRVTVRRDGAWQVTASARLGPNEFQQRQAVTLPISEDELRQARQVAKEEGTSLDDWLATLVRDAIRSR